MLQPKKIKCLWVIFLRRWLWFRLGVTLNFWHSICKNKVVHERTKNRALLFLTDVWLVKCVGEILCVPLKRVPKPDSNYSSPRILKLVVHQSHANQRLSFKWQEVLSLTSHWVGQLSFLAIWRWCVGLSWPPIFPRVTINLIYIMYDKAHGPT